MDKETIQQQIDTIETAMQQADFWSDVPRAQAQIRELQSLKDALQGVGKYDRGNAVITIISGAGGDDAEDFARMLAQMYYKFAKKKNWDVFLIHESVNERVGYKSVTFEVSGKDVYGMLKHESGVHRLVRVSPFNANAKRHTSFVLVEVVPKISQAAMPELSEADVDFEFTKSGGPGGQNVNKRETAVRATHRPTGITVSVREQRTQEANRDRALELLRGKLFKKAEDEHKSLVESMQSEKATEIEWGSQIRNYVLHPYKLVKDLRTNVETSNVDKVLEDGDLDEFIVAEQKLLS